MSDLAIRAYSGDGSSIGVCYQWQSDRFRHSIDLHASNTSVEVASGDNGGVWLSSDPEGSSALQGSSCAEGSDLATSDPAAWPADPPLQQLSIEPIHGSQAILGVGQAGRGHWSSSTELLSATVDRMATDQTAGLRFDIACRCPVAAEVLGSQYRLADHLQAPRIDGASVWVSDGEQTMRLDARIPGSTVWQTATDSPWSWDPAQRRLRLRVPEPSGSLPRTTRWQLSIAFA